LDLIHREALPMAANRETPAAVFPVRPACGAGRPDHDECRFFLSGSHSLKRFTRFFTLFFRRGSNAPQLAACAIDSRRYPAASDREVHLTDSLHWFARLALIIASPQAAGGVMGGAG
jgi:hypothetical protein